MDKFKNIFKRNRDSKTGGEGAVAKRKPDNIQKTFKRLFIYVLVFVGLM